MSIHVLLETSISPGCRNKNLAKLRGSLLFILKWHLRNVGSGQLEGWEGSSHWTFFSQHAVRCCLLSQTCHLQRSLLSSLSLLFAQLLWVRLCASPEGTGSIFLTQQAILAWQHLPRCILQPFFLPFHTVILSTTPWSVPVSICDEGTERLTLWCFSSFSWELRLRSCVFLVNPSHLGALFFHYWWRVY